MTDPLIPRVSPERWQAAQAYERASAAQRAHKGDDWNEWWMVQFDEYRIIRWGHFKQVLEVGCGPNTNVRLILPMISLDWLHLEDPLIGQYLTGKTYVASLSGRTGAWFLNEPLEELTLPDASIDLLVCINVLDHVQDAARCMEQIGRVLAPAGVLVLGQDLSNAEDLARCPSSWEDIGHPIKLDEQFFAPYLAPLTPLLRKVLPREQGRNPQAHYGTLVYIGQKG